MEKVKKTKSKLPKELDVKRITVDERFGDWSIRLLIATLKGKARTSGKINRLQNINCWTHESCVYVDRDNFMSNLGLDSDISSIARAVNEVIGKVEQTPTKELLWLGLEEGQVFIVGKFHVKGDRFKPEYLTISSTPTIEFLRIDRIESFKDNSKNLYSRALCGKEKSNG
jgi:transcriptional antiterminator Rof (Rho-off)